MRDEYDFSNARRNPYLTENAEKKNEQQITINIDYNALAFFKKKSEVSGIPVQTLIKHYLSDCAENNRQLNNVGE